MAASTKSRIWIVQGGYGIWVVRAPSEDAAITVALAGSPEHSGGGDFGLERGELAAREASPGGEPEILESKYA